MFPTLDTLKVESAKSAAVSVFFADFSINTFKSESIYKMLFVYTALMFGTVRPSLLSIATLKLWSFLITNRCIKPSESKSLSTYEFIKGYSVIAIEQALTKKGSIVSLGWTDFISFLSLISYVASISSENVKNGIERDSVIVLVIAFLIPVIYFTLKRFHCAQLLTDHLL